MLLAPFDPALSQEATSLDFRDTAFFQVPPGSTKAPQLPTPAEVLAKAGSLAKNAVYEELHLFVKFGGYHSVRREEAQAMQAIRRTFCTSEIHVPEIYGWRAEGGLFFIYMEWILGVRLRNIFKTLTTEELRIITAQIARSVDALRALDQDPWYPHTEPYTGMLLFCWDSS
jgi:hypothetical protein